MNTETINQMIADLTVKGLEAEANGLDPAPYNDAADALHDAVTALNCVNSPIPYGTESYWG